MVLLFVFGLLCFVSSYLPVVMIHGYKGSYKDWDDYVDYINKYHPGTELFPIHFYPGESSEKTNLFVQTDYVVDQINQLYANKTLTSKFILIGHSQGGLIARALGEILGGDMIDTFISLSGVQAGYFGAGCGDMKFPAWLEDFALNEASIIVYTKYFQEHYSFTNYWNDPKKVDLYLKKCKYLTTLNNETDNPQSEEYKENFIKIRKVVLFGGPDDECIKPPKSALFGFYERDSFSKVLDMKDRDVYKLDSFGLKTLDEENRLFLYSVSGMKHIDWIQSEQFFVNYILDLLV